MLVDGQLALTYDDKHQAQDLYTPHLMPLQFCLLPCSTMRPGIALTYDDAHQAQDLHLHPLENQMRGALFIRLEEQSRGQMHIHHLFFPAQDLIELVSKVGPNTYLQALH